MYSGGFAVKVENISKCYRIGLKKTMHDSLAGALIDFFKSPVNNYRKYRSLYRFDDIKEKKDSDSSDRACDVIWALRDISFEVKEGQVLGIIGRNGAGKSTLLKILSRITDPTMGRAEIRGKISSLLEVGTGFHPELTGRDNVYLNGAVLGMKKKEIDRRFDQIVDFSGVQKFIDTPVKRYSSGMTVRLAFAVAAHLEPEILIIDEVLAVGDAEFQNKCLGKMENIKKEGRTVLFVSHNMGAVSQLCTSCVMLDNGKVAASGSSKQIVEEYLANIFKPVNNLDLSNLDVRDGDGRLRFVSAYLETEGRRTAMPISGNPLDIVFEFDSTSALSCVRFMLTIFNQRGVAVTHCAAEACGNRFSVPENRGRVVCHIPKLPLPLGQYKISAAAFDDKGKLDWVPTACIFNVEACNFFKTSFVPPLQYSTALVEHTWKLAHNGDSH